MRSRFEALAAELIELGREYDPAAVSGDDAEAIGDTARVIIRAAGSIEVRSDARAADANAWRRAGAKSAEEWLAKKSGTSKAKARKKLTLGGQLDRHDELRDRYASGRVSEDQAEIVGGAADENPNAEADLLDAAEEESLATLRQRAAQAKAEVSDEEERQAKLHEERYASAGSDEEGAYRGSFRMSAFQGGIFDTIWQRFRDQIAKDAKKQGSKLNAGQIGADALVLMAQTAAEVDAGDTPTRLGLPDVTLHLLVDHDAWQRGRTETGETWEIDGVQALRACKCECSVPLAEVGYAHNRSPQAQENPGSKVCVSDLASRPRRCASGTEHSHIKSCHHIPAVLDTAITIRDRVCQHPGCDARWRLQRDHKLAVGLGGRTTYRQLQRLCWNHHEAKTREDIRKIRARKHARAGPAP